jgi:cytochrome c-type biogenesis protein
MGPDSINVGLAFLAGALAFFSPCVLPLIPSYFAIMAGSSLEALKSGGKSRKTILANTLFFIAGFSILFVALGVLFTATFGLLAGVGQIINVVSGSIVILLGLHFIFDFWKILDIEKRFHLRSRPTNYFGSLLFGIAFGAGWSPCVGPILGTILLLAGTTGKVLEGVILLFVFSLGLGLPFILTGTFFSFALRQLNKIKAHLRLIQSLSGGFLILIGTLILLGRFQRVNIFLAVLSQSIGSWGSANQAFARLIFGLIFLALSLLILFLYLRRIRGERSRMAEAVDSEQSDSKSSDGDAASVRLFRPFYLFFFLFFIVTGILSATGTLRLTQLLANWFAYRGL